jgi:hypothetical protein
MVQPLYLSLLSGIFFFATSSLAQPVNATAAQPALRLDNLRHCQSISDSVERLNCYEKPGLTRPRTYNRHPG